MSLLVKNYTFSAGAIIYAAEHNDNFDTIFNGFNGNIDNSNIKAGAAIVDTKLNQITTAGKVHGSSLTGLASINTATAGLLPGANIDTGTTAGKIVGLTIGGKLPAVDGSLVTGLSGDNFPVGSQVGFSYFATVGTKNCTTAVPTDNNARTSSEGDQILTVSHTPKSNSNKLLIHVVAIVGQPTTGQNYCLILMDGTTVLATGRNQGYASTVNLVALNYIMTSPGTSAKTFNVNLGGNATAYLNCYGTADVDAGKCTSSITITEIKG